MFGTILKSAAAVAATGAAALVGVALASDGYVYARRKITGKSESSSSSSKKSKRKSKAKAKKPAARRRPAAQLSKNKRAA